ncbi:hypothetical protein OEG84_04810 [Hoeflea sp. G2-23]|uniref:Lipoprotein n=1 Tax=Hoeflea algicola TaxID=2983763 RepID=A0ABT3Z5N0_9HYPH|nr:hypothetical protein [Hoeflea algicola]MCY0147055.1 hypothetical protein [Hoeflea algicola]
MNIPQNVLPALGALMVLVLSGCQTASLEDAAPKTVPSNLATVSAQTDTPDTGTADAQATPPVPQTVAKADDDAPASTIIRRNPGFKSVIPIEKTTPVATEEFVESGARRTGEYPVIGRKQTAANSQLSATEKSAAEAEMAKLLRERAQTPDGRAEYEARLKELRDLAKNHAADTQREIEQ